MLLTDRGVPQSKKKKAGAYPWVLTPQVWPVGRILSQVPLAALIVGTAVAAPEGQKVCKGKPETWRLVLQTSDTNVMRPLTVDM